MILLAAIGKFRCPVNFPVLVEDDDEFAFLTQVDGGADSGPGLVIGAREADFDGAGVEDFEAVLVSGSGGDLLGSEAGVGVINFNELDGSTGVVNDVSLNEGGPASGEGEASEERCGDGERRTERHGDSVDAGPDWYRSSTHRFAKRRGIQGFFSPNQTADPSTALPLVAPLRMTSSIPTLRMTCRGTSAASPRNRRVRIGSFSPERWAAQLSGRRGRAKARNGW